MMGRFASVVALLLLLSFPVVAPPGPARAAGGDTLVSVGSPPSPFPQNKQNEPAVTLDPMHPQLVVAGANDELDLQPCPAIAPSAAAARKGKDKIQLRDEDSPSAGAAATRCPFTDGVGTSGVYFSFDGGQSWTQPTYQGWTARDCSPTTCAPHVGPIGTLPKYYEHGLVSDGDPALAFGPRQGANGAFSWAAGSRLYYANLASNFPGAAGTPGAEAIAVSRTDDVRAAANGAKDAWLDPVIVSRQNAALFSDKDAIWADNAATSRFFGNVYVCNIAFRSNGQGGAPGPVMVARSTDGGASWQQRQISQAANTNSGAGRSGGRQGCTIRTDSTGIVYVFWDGGLNRQSVQYLARSVDGGQTFERPRVVATKTDCGQFDAISGDVTFDGIAGARTDSFPSVDIANGAPTGVGAPNTIALAWCDASAGVNHEQALVQTSTDGGATWSKPVNGAEGSDRPDFPAIAIAPDGRDVYLVYDGFRDPWQTDTTSPRRFQGVVRHADVGASLGGFVTLQRGATGDARSSSANALTSEFLGDYTDAVATNDAGIAVWNDARAADVCDAINTYRAALANPNPPDAPDPLTACPARFGNTDIVGGSYADPSPDAAATRGTHGKAVHGGSAQHHRAPQHKHRSR